MLISMFFRGPDRIVRAIVDKEDEDFWKGLGGYSTPGEIEFETPSQIYEGKETGIIEGDIPFISGDKGPGVPGSYEFHVNVVNEIDDFIILRKYVREVTGKNMRHKTGNSMIQYRKTALKLIRGVINGNKSG